MSLTTKQEGMLRIRPHAPLTPNIRPSARSARSLPRLSKSATISPSPPRKKAKKMSSPKRRIETDVMKLLMSDYEVSLVNDNMQEFFIRFHGPTETPFEKGIWKIHVELPDQYPYKSPSIGFCNKIFHPNIDEMSGSVCLDVVNSTWSPMFDLLNIFESFIPQLLRYPNPADPLNAEAATLLLRQPEQYNEKVKDYVRRFASSPTSKEEGEESGSDSGSEEDESDGEMSDMGAVSEDDGLEGMEA